MSIGLTREELERLLVADGPRSGGLITLLAYNGLRVDEALSSISAISWATACCASATRADATP